MKLTLILSNLGGVVLSGLRGDWALMILCAITVVALASFAKD